MKLPTDIHKRFLAFRGSAQQKLVERIGGVRQLLDTCESPLEQLFLLEIASLMDAGPRFKDGRLAWLMGELGGFDYGTEAFLVHIVPQKRISLAKENYRADFLFDLTCYDPRTGDYEQVVSLVVEIDGHDFHEKTLAQSKRDKARDRYLIAEGFRVFRYTGSEIYKNPLRAVLEVDKFLASAGRKFLHQSKDAA